ncbi:MAG: hypothetical protein KAT06_01950 [Gammaproteobacteria bacterium]|nr:hypothetical protein [Gammaproteobacteria bacterium]
MKKIALLSLLSLFLFSGCRYYGGGVIVDGGYSYNDHVPSHAPAYGHRSNFHRYQYYPYADIYFDTGRNMYFYLDNGGHWSFSINLPLYLRSRLNRGYVEIEMEADRPYLKHKYYKNKYRNTKYKRKYKYRKDYKSNRDYKNGYKKDYRYQDKTYRNKGDRYRSNDNYRKEERYNRKDSDRNSDRYKRKDSDRNNDRYNSKDSYRNKDKYRNKEKYKNNGNDQIDEKKNNRKKKDRKDERD